VPLYKINTPLTSPQNILAVIEVLNVIASQAQAWGYTVTSASTGSGADTNKLRLNITVTLTADQLAHLGLTT
jgi:hypothetical protein